MRLQINCEDKVGIAEKVFAVLVKQEINIKGIDADVETGQIFVHIPDLELSALQLFMPKLRLIDGIIDVKTTTFMPSERARNVLDTLVRAMPDPVVSIDKRANVFGVNDIAQTRIGLEAQDIIGQPANLWLKGFNFQKYLSSKEPLAQTRKITFFDENFIADILPTMVDGDNNKQVLTGALIILKSEARLGQQVKAFKHIKDKDFNSIVQNSSLQRKTVREAKRMAVQDSSILIVGETGTGKEVFARACHNSSERAEFPFIVINCASLPDTEVESALFGYKQDSGDFQIGIFEQADGGTIFLDGVSEMSPVFQAKLIRVIEDSSFRRVGDNSQYKTNVRLISSTNKDLLPMVESGSFREDLYYRLNVLNLSIAPLRERPKDIMPLAETFLSKAVKINHRHGIAFEPKCAEFISQYPWPGNIRQLQNVIIKAIALLEGEQVTIDDLQLPSFSQQEGYLAEKFEGTLEDEVKRYEASILRKLYPAYPSTRQLAQKLGVSHTAIANKLREYNINKKTVKI